MAIQSDAIEAARAGGLPLERLIATVWPEAFRIALGILRDRGLAEDAAQEACAAIARSLPALTDARAFAAWSYKIAVNCALTAARRRPRTLTLETLADRSSSFDSSAALDLYDALAALPVVQRAVLLLHYYAGFKSADIASATGLRASTVRFHLMLARRSLRAALGTSTSHAPATSDEVLPNAR